MQGTGLAPTMVMLVAISPSSISLVGVISSVSIGVTLIDFVAPLKVAPP